MDPELRRERERFLKETPTAENRVRRYEAEEKRKSIGTKPASALERKKKVDALLAGSKLSMLQSGKYIEPSEVCRVSRRQLKKERKAEREKTNGPGWFNMGAPELTTERKNDMEALRLRSVLETKRFYKRNNITSIPKYFQVGRVVETPADFYSSRIPKKQRKQTVAEELVADLE